MVSSAACYVLRAAYGYSYGARPTMHCRWGWLCSFRSFFVPGDLDVWPLTLTFELWRDFCTMYLTTKFDRPKFSRSEVIVRTTLPPKLRNKQTNKQTDTAKTSTSLRYTTPAGNNKDIRQNDHWSDQTYRVMILGGAWKISGGSSVSSFPSSCKQCT